MILRKKIKNLYNSLSKYKLIIVLFLDVISIIAGFYLSYLLRFDFGIPEPFLSNTLIVLPTFLLVKLPVFYLMHLYRGMWRYTSLEDMFNILKALAVSQVGLFIVISLINLVPDIPRSIYILDFGITFALIAGSRVFIRIIYNRVRNGFLDRDTKELLVIGAGSAGEQIAREAKKNPQLKYRVKAFLDNDRYKVGAYIHNIPIVGKIEDITGLTFSYDEILIAIPSADGEQMRKILEICKKTGKPVKTLPGFDEIIDGEVSIRSIREVSINDLLGREEINLDRGSIDEFLNGKRVVITGAGGSIGSELVRQCLSFSPAELTLIENNEYNLFKIRQECDEYGGDIEINPLLADIRDKSNIEWIFSDHRPEIILHAAAYKHVPIQENFPWEAVSTNIKGTQNVIEMADKYNAEKFILVSTDKAVRPTSVMGVSKRIAELLVKMNGLENNLKCMAVRFGNVLGSSGSVIPIFQKQIKDGGPVTVTHPQVKRYFMSISEASQLILQAGAIGQGGEIFVLEMGEPVNIEMLARDLISLSGLKPDKDIPITYTGLRPGEKMFEELITEEENVVHTKHEKIMVLKSGSNGNNYSKINHNIGELYQIAKTHEKPSILLKMKEIVPEYNIKQATIRQDPVELD